MHWFVNKIFSREIQRPSEAKLWQMPSTRLFPRKPSFPFLPTPLDVQAASYFAASDKILNFSSIERFSCISMRFFLLPSYRTLVLDLSYHTPFLNASFFEHTFCHYSHMCYCSRMPSNGILLMLRIPNQQNLQTELYPNLANLRL